MASRKKLISILVALVAVVVASVLYLALRPALKRSRLLREI